MSSELWYAYDGLDGERYFLIVVGPISPDKKRADGQPWESGYFATGPYTKQPLVLNFISAFDHEPSELEELHMVPEEHRAQYIAQAASKLVEEQTPAQGEEGTDGTVFLTEEELVALSIAVEYRVEVLAEIRDRHVVQGRGRRTPDVCQEQISNLISVFQKLDLKRATWEY